jgi:SOS-response transcriptional repressor LexA
MVDIWDWVRGYIDRHGYPPSRKEIGAGCACSTSTACKYIDIMAAAGWVEVGEVDQRRALRLVKRPPEH